MLRREKEKHRNRFLRWKRSRPARADARGNGVICVGEKRVVSFLLRSDLLLQAVPSLRSPGATCCSSLAAWSSGLTVAAVTRALTAQAPPWSSGRAALPMVPHDAMELAGSRVRACSRHGREAAQHMDEARSSRGSPPQADLARGHPAPSASASRRLALVVRARSTAAVVPRTPRSQPWTRRRKAVHLG